MLNKHGKNKDLKLFSDIVRWLPNYHFYVKKIGLCPRQVNLSKKPSSRSNDWCSYDQTGLCTHQVLRNFWQALCHDDPRTWNYAWTRWHHKDFSKSKSHVLHSPAKKVCGKNQSRVARAHSDFFVGQLTVWTWCLLASWVFCTIVVPSSHDRISPQRPEIIGQIIATT